MRLWCYFYLEMKEVKLMELYELDQFIQLLTERSNFKANVFYSTQWSSYYNMIPENQEFFCQEHVSWIVCLVNSTQYRAGARLVSTTWRESYIAQAHYNGVPICGSKHVSRAGIYNLNTINVLGQTIRVSHRYCRMLSSIPALYPLNVSNTLTQVWPNVSIYCQIYPIDGRQNCPHLRNCSEAIKSFFSLVEE